MADSTTHSTAFVPDDGAQRRAVPTKVDARAPFLYKAHPQRWGVINGKVLPVLGTLKFIPGCAGVDQVLDRRTGEKVRVTTGIARSDARERGWEVIPADAIPDEWVAPGEVKSYLRRPEGRPDVTLSMFERTYPGSDVIEADLDKYTEWLQWLIDNKIVSPCPDYLLRSMEAKQSEAVSRIRDMAARYPSYAANLADAERDLKVIQGEIEKRSSSGAKSVKRSKSRTEAVADPEAEGS